MKKFGIKKFTLKKEKPAEKLNLTKIKNEEPKNEVEVDVELVEKYEQLQKEYVINPTPELGIEITKLYNKLYNPDNETEEHDSGESVQQIEGSPEAVTPAPKKSIMNMGLAEMLGKIKKPKENEPIVKIEIPDKIPTNANLSEAELKKLEQVKSEPLPKPKELDTNERLEKIAVEQNEKIEKEIEKDAHYQQQLMREEERKKDEEAKKVLEEHQKNYILNQQAKQPEIQLKRIRWRETIPDLEDYALEQFTIFINDAEYDQSYTEQVLSEFDRENKEDEESIEEAEKVANDHHDVMVEDSDPDFEQNKIDDDKTIENLKEAITEKEFEIEPPVDNSPKEHEGETFVVPDHTQDAEKLFDSELKPEQLTVKPDAKVDEPKPKTSKWKLFKKKEKEESPMESLPLVAEPVERVPEADLIMPNDLDPELKKVWEVLPRENKEEIIKKHKDQVEEAIEKKKKSVFGNKINFSLKKKQLKKQTDAPEKPNLLTKILRKDPNDLRNIDAYCHMCKHEIKHHQHKGKSAGCSECGCLTTVKKILEVNKIKFNLDYDEVDNTDTGKTCKCGHREIVHKERGFCEEKDCYCITYQQTADD